MIEQGKYIHISSVKEAKTVIDYYKQLGYRTVGLTLENCLDFPFLGEYLSEDKLIAGWRNQDENVVSYKAWLETVTHFEPLKETDYIQIASELFDGL